MRQQTSLALAAVGVAAVAATAGYWFATQRMSHDTATPPAIAEGKKPLYWHDPMYPQQRFDKPGKSPFMDMMLVPVYADASGDTSSVTVSSRMSQNLGVRTAEVTQGVLENTVEAVGAVAFDERAVALVQARVNGYVERLFVRAPLDPVVKGQPLAEILAPEWVAAQEEYLALRASDHASPALVAAARQRLDLLGMAPETIAAIETGGKTRARITLTAPISGVVGELGVREGMTVAPGLMLFRLNGLSTVWINAEVPETQASWVKPGESVVATVPAYPGESFKGTVTALLPEVNAATRTLKARIEAANPQGRLKPGMYATVNFTPQAKREVLMVPSEAVIRTGTRNVVVVAEAGQDGQQRFKPVDVETGAEAKGMTEIRKGLERGTKIVVSGQFLIDSEANLKASGARLGDAPAADTHPGEGRVERIGKDSVTLSHGPLPTLKMGAMTMDFATPKGVPANVKEGSLVSFSLRQTHTGGLEVATIVPRETKK
ncbi:efflux RND transporter periplasmic adaptor subunit [Usitatibacter palustris]|uniref:Cation efflux system protein CusB n=1 Tax=Usitatibacter palustris TaxID=2732487 RepID=A0A6M4HDB8_9PROT|nr:efflux RND transporter periplasmic adaptor subunit [Usitatibacter palustris]QJR16554.1 Cation efflux system protein CusB [Usitatibacter palustris]